MCTTTCASKHTLTLKQNTRFPGTEITGSLESPHEYWELNPGSPLGQQMLLITESTLLPPSHSSGRWFSSLTSQSKSCTQEIFLTIRSEVTVSSGGGLNENDLQRFRNLKTWSSIGGTVRVDLFRRCSLAGGSGGGGVLSFPSFFLLCFLLVV